MNVRILSPDRGRRHCRLGRKVRYNRAMTDTPPKGRPNQGRRRRMKKEDWEFPSDLQPDAGDYAFDLERALNAVVSLKSYVPGGRVHREYAWAQSGLAAA